VKVGDLVIRSNDLVKESVGRGIVLDSQESADGMVYFEVQWFFNDERLWYGTLELEVISESR
jgi:hypothetical protein